MKIPAFYCMKTLMGGVPDINRRIIYADDTQIPVKIFNRDMKPWTLEMQAEVDRELKALNDIAGEPRYFRIQ